MVIWVNQIYLLTLKIIETINMTSTSTAKHVDLTTEEKKTIRAVILASSVGTLIEWYDFYIFGALATIISTKFFPASNPTAAYLSVLATFAAGFIVRPFGALVFGRLGDLVGRKYTFLLTLIIMGGSTLPLVWCPVMRPLERQHRCWSCSCACYKVWPWAVNTAERLPMWPSTRLPINAGFTPVGFKPRLPWACSWLSG